MPKERILVVEDDNQVRQYVVRQLRRLGYNVLTAGDGPSALTLMEQTPGIDLLLLDVVMPGGMNGLEVGVAARKLRPGIPILLVSGFPDSALAKAGSNKMPFEFLEKPYQLIELARRVRTLLEAARSEPKC